ncbi:3-oxoacyl-[acyl-carrier-protein] synthase II [Galdieria sulphuraria]|uniref:3-oxoacyl-[acyl-carrier-protein] synthase, mitochondrial n=1 Tax=Galdieria sulphuraria TaxID=130081 RepID=M2Y7Q7_GALSU|nr:3-oxoacyl-[acyl-carrier-protein] synthase II [Galdieria sulphuraria]EME32113.1 3-oxoacyl-[acyl-carrier-protein] synthase II [Galdieria sulphuraria]|eukprot:XP_005708633.1 3-oxoacyl-[acyl-carrier-protein] synthase II [Galdieria sulphuraria]
MHRLFGLRLLHQLVNQNRRRVVVTGIGLVTPLSVGTNSTWNRLIAGECAVDRITAFDASRFPIQIAAEVPRSSWGDLGPCRKINCKKLQDEEFFDATRILGFSEDDKKKTPEFIQFALAASKEALEDANWFPVDATSLERTGVAVGAGITSIPDIIEANRLIESSERGYRRVSPFFVPRILTNMAAGYISMKYGFQGPNHSVSTACATGSHSIGDAFRMVRDGDADVMIAGGSEACIHEVSLVGFSRAKALASSYNDSPQRASRPFDKDREGFVIGEGAGILVLEELNHAVARKAKIYAQVEGYGLSGDAHHITAPRSDGHGAWLAMKRALDMSGLSPLDIDYVNAHATSTPLGDEIENTAIRRLLSLHCGKERNGPSRNGRHPPDVLAVSSTKGAIGHLLGSAGAVEAAFTVLSIFYQTIPPTLNLDCLPSEEFDLDYVPEKAKECRIRAALNNSFGFGGTNASLLFTEPNI